MTRRPLFLALPLLLAAACSGGDDTGMQTGALCADETRAAEYVSGLEIPTDQVMFKVRLVEVLVDDTPKPPDRGDNVWTFEVTDSGGAPVPDATVEVKSWMPDHGHGTNPLWSEARSMNGGTYEVGAFDLFMGGFWEFTFQVEDGASMDVGRVGFCIEG